LVPVTNGAIPVSPEGGHSSQSGTLFEFERPFVPAVDERPEAGAAAGAEAPGPAPAPLPKPPAEAALAAELLGVAAAVAGVVAAPRNVTAPYGFATVVPAIPPVVAVVCAAAGAARIRENRNAM
jgi:hypothetical protein